MKIAFIFNLALCGRIFNFKELETSSRGITGSELACLEIAKEMVKKGHEVSLFIAQLLDVNEIFGIKLYSTNQLTIIDSTWDAVCAFNEPDILRNIPEGPLRIVNQQWNDFNYCQSGFEDFVDVFTSPSEHHKNYIKNLTKTPEKWKVVNNGCNPQDYTKKERIPGSVIWASSPDRGLHNLLSCWSKIKKEVPEANLKLFYNCNYDVFDKIGGKIAHRIQYVKHAVEKLKSLDVVQVGSVSRREITEAMNKSMVLGYSCDTISFTESFSVTTMEACAAGVLPIITSTDAFRELYGEAVPMVDLPINLDEYANLVIKGLKDQLWREETVEKCKILAEKYTWKHAAEQFENIINENKNVKTYYEVIENLKIAFVYGPMNFSNVNTDGFDFHNIYNDQRGLTGSEYGCLRVAEELSKKHDVHLYTFYKNEMPKCYENITLHKFENINDDFYDSVVSWNHPNDLKYISQKTARIVSFQINDFCFCEPEVKNYIDLWVAPSEFNIKHLSEITYQNYILDRKKWTVIPDGCDSDKFTSDEKIPGRVIWASSPDRGLHRLISCWFKIKKEVPHASLRIFYKLQSWIDNNFLNARNLVQDNNASIVSKKMYYRMLYINNFIRQLQKNKHLDLDIKFCDSVSKNQINKEMSQAEVLAFFCDTMAYTEGFSMSLMEGCTARSCPVSSPVDALGSIYGNHIPMTSDSEEYTNLVIKALKEKDFRDSVNEKAYNLSLRYQWKDIAKQYEKVIIEQIKMKK
jgi:glycosyltransferase involved in cell wall biosynthesis